MNVVLNTAADKTVGSARIWIYDLYEYFLKIGVKAKLNDWNNYEKYDVVIFGKGTDVTEFEKAKLLNSKIKCGAVNPSDNKAFNLNNLIKNRAYNIQKKSTSVLDAADFYIVGSVEERDYFLQYNKNTFIFPLVENYFTKQKEHTDKEKIILSYHGNKIHLHQFDPNLKRALEKLRSKHDIELTAIYNKEHLGEWKKGRPNIPVTTVQWRIDTIEKNLLKSDIGLVPCVNVTSGFRQKLILAFTKFMFLGQENSGPDYVLRFKQKANAGRAFVYHQLNIPVVAGFVPSMSHIIGTNQNGFIAHTEDGWYYSIEKLIQSKLLREEMAARAKKEFEKQYNPHAWAQDLYENIKSL